VVADFVGPFVAEDRAPLFGRGMGRLVFSHNSHAPTCVVVRPVRKLQLPYRAAFILDHTRVVTWFFFLLAGMVGVDYEE